jgi:hypothetical protein
MVRILTALQIDGEQHELRGGQRLEQGVQACAQEHPDVHSAGHNALAHGLKQSCPCLAALQVDSEQLELRGGQRL